MKKAITLLPLIILTCTSIDRNPCSCPVIFDEATQLIEEAYAGYEDKVNEDTRSAYEKRKEEFALKSQSIDDTKACHYLLTEFIEFHQDNHLGAFYQEDANPSNKRIISVNERALSKHLNEKENLHPLEGIWESLDQKYKYAIVPDLNEIGSEYAMVVLKHPDSTYESGTVIYEFTNVIHGSNYIVYKYNEDFSITQSVISHNENVLDLFTHKVIKKGVLEVVQDNFKNEVQLNKINDSTYYARFPVFNEKEYKQLDSILWANLDNLATTPYFIFDIRNNGGGNSAARGLLLRLLYTDTIKGPGWGRRISQPFLDYLKMRVESGKTSKEAYENKLKQGIGFHTEPPTFTTFDSIFTNPRKVAVLMNEGCSSSSEFFIYLARQSDKVKLFGRHSSGTMDYGEAWGIPIACENIVLSIATARNGWIDTNPIDKVGFQPDIEIPSDTDWVKFVLDYWRKDAK